MKICPQCHARYTDPTLNFCLQDGAVLIGRATDPEPAAPTVEFGDEETVVTGRPSEEATVVRTDPSGSGWDESLVTRLASVRNEDRRSSKTLLTVALTAVSMLVLFGLTGVGAYVYYNSNETETAGLAPDRDEAETDERTEKEGQTAPPDVEEKNEPEPKTEPKPEPKPDKDKKPEIEPGTDAARIRKEIGALMYKWKSLAVARRLDPYMDLYAPKVDYYRKNGASRSFVRRDKQGYFKKYTTVSIDLSNISITPSKDGRTASAVYDKQFRFEGGGEKVSGKVRSILGFKKTGDRWLITSEKDLKVYYVNK